LPRLRKNHNRCASAAETPTPRIFNGADHTISECSMPVHKIKSQYKKFGALNHLRTLFIVYHAVERTKGFSGIKVIDMKVRQAEENGAKGSLYREKSGRNQCTK